MAQPIIPPLPSVGSIQSVTSNAGNHAQNANLPVGTPISGFVINRDADNNPIIRTAQGDITLQSSLFMKTGSEVVFQAAPALPSGFQILSIDHLAPADYAAQFTRGLPTDSITPPEIEGQIPLPVANPETQTDTATPPQITLPILQSVVLQANAVPPASLPPFLANLPPGTPLTLTIADVELPPIPLSVASLPDVATIAHLLPAAQAQTPSANIAPPPPNSSAVNTALNAGNAAYAQSAFADRVAPLLTSAVAPTTNTGTQSALPNSANAPTNVQQNATPSTPRTPSQPATQSPQLSTAAGAIPAKLSATGQLFQATVIGHGEDGLNIVQTNFATLKIYTAQPLPTGTNIQMQVEVAHTELPPALTAFSDLAARLPASTPQDFDYLAQALTQLTTQDPNAARVLMQQLPVLGPQFTSGLLFFLTAVKNGTLTETLQNSRASKAIDALSPGTLSRFAKDVGALNQNFTNSPLTDWKAVTLPLIFGHEMHPARLYIRDESSGGQANTGSTPVGQRFIFDVQLSALGPLQFDGFIRPGNTKSFELYMRSASPLESEISQNIRQIFESTTQATGLTGNIVFQTGHEHFVKPQLKPLPPAAGDGSRTILA